MEVRRYVSDQGVVVKATVADIEHYCREVLRWRTPLDYGTMLRRFISSGSTQYNKVLHKMKEDGY